MQYIYSSLFGRVYKPSYEATYSVLYVFSGLFGGEFHRKGHILVEPNIGVHMEHSL